MKVIKSAIDGEVRNHFFGQIDLLAIRLFFYGCNHQPKELAIQIFVWLCETTIFLEINPPNLDVLMYLKKYPVMSNLNDIFFVP